MVFLVSAWTFLSAASHPKPNCLEIVPESKANSSILTKMGKWADVQFSRLLEEVLLA